MNFHLKSPANQQNPCFRMLLFRMPTWQLSLELGFPPRRIEAFGCVFLLAPGSSNRLCGSAEVDGIGEGLRWFNTISNLCQKAYFLFCLGLNLWFYQFFCGDIYKSSAIWMSTRVQFGLGVFFSETPRLMHWTQTKGARRSPNAWESYIWSGGMATITLIIII